MKGLGKVIAEIIIISLVVILVISGISKLTSRSSKNKNTANNNAASNTVVVNNTSNNTNAANTANAADNTANTANNTANTTDPTPATPPEEKGGALKKTVFVGDSICSGFRVYKLVDPNNCLAYGNVGARSLFDYKFTVNEKEYELIDALKLVDPSYVVFSMGMNDINMTTTEQYCTNYDNILAKVHEALPKAKLFVASITPTRDAASFPNDKIDSFNAALKSHFAGTDYTYVDVSSSLKDASNSLVSTYHSGDGIHLSPAAYNVFLSVLADTYKGMGIEW